MNEIDNVPKRVQLGCLALILAVVVGGAFLLVSSGIFDRPTVYVRNESASTVGVGILGNSKSLWGDQVFWVPPWQEGFCAAVQFNMGSGNKPQAAVRLVTRHTYTGPEATFTKAPYYVRIDASGVFHTDEPLPADEPGCRYYTYYIEP